MPRVIGDSLRVTGAVDFDSTLDMSSHIISNVTDPAAAQDAATKAYVDAEAQKVNGIDSSVSANNFHYLADIGDITTLQALTVDITFTAGGGNMRTFIIYVDITLHKASTASIYGWFRGWIAVRYNGSGAAIIEAYDVSHETSGTDACSLAAITDGIRIVVNSSAFGNTLDRNTVKVSAVTNAAGITVTPSIA